MTVICKSRCTKTAFSLWLQMLPGNVGFECGGVNPIRGQNNVQGACDMGALPNVYPGYQRVDNPNAQAKFRAAWSVGRLSEKPGLMLPSMLEGMLDGRIKSLYVFGENLANTEPDIKQEVPHGKRTVHPSLHLH